MIVLPWLITAASLYLSLWLHNASSRGGVGGGVAFLISRLSPEWRESWNELRRVLLEHGKRIAAIVAGIFFGFTQRVACGFGLGSLLSILFHVTVFDLAFGWESTLSIGDEFICLFVNIISAPWSWLWSASVPTLEQVRESRFSYLAGMEAASVDATRSWWPFIVGSLGFYVVIPRFFLVAYATWKTSRRFSTLDFNRTQDIALHRRLSGHLFQTDEPSRTGFLEMMLRCTRHLQKMDHGTCCRVRGLCKRGGCPLKVESILHGKINQISTVEVDYADEMRKCFRLFFNRKMVWLLLPAGVNPVDAIAVTLQSFLMHRRPRIMSLFFSDRSTVWLYGEGGCAKNSLGSTCLG